MPNQMHQLMKASQTLVPTGYVCVCICVCLRVCLCGCVRAYVCSEAASAILDDKEGFNFSVPHIMSRQPDFRHPYYTSAQSHFHLSFSHSFFFFLSLVHPCLSFYLFVILSFLYLITLCVKMRC